MEISVFVFVGPFNLALLLTGTYITSITGDPQGHPSSIQRLYIMFLPIIWYFIALIIARKISGN